MKITVERVASSVAHIAAEHGVPNGASLDEIAGTHHRLAVAHVLRWKLQEVNAALQASGLVVTYHREAKGTNRIVIDRIDCAD